MSKVPNCHPRHHLVLVKQCAELCPCMIIPAPSGYVEPVLMLSVHVMQSKITSFPQFQLRLQAQNDAVSLLRV